MKRFTWKQINDGKITPEQYIIGKLSLLGYKEITGKWMREGYLGENWCVFGNPIVITKAIKIHRTGMFSADLRYPSNCISRWRYLDDPEHIVKHIKYWLDIMEYKKLYKKLKNKSWKKSQSKYEKYRNNWEQLRQ